MSGAYFVYPIAPGLTVREAKKGREIVREEVGKFIAWIDSLEQVPTIAALRRKLDDIRDRELQKSLSGGLRDLSEKQREALEDMTVAMIIKFSPWHFCRVLSCFTYKAPTYCRENYAKNPLAS